MTAPIVVGVDGSQHSDRALAWAADEAVRRDRPLLVVHAVEVWAYQAPMTARPDLTRTLTRAAAEIIASAEQRVRRRHPTLEVTTELVPRATARALAERSAEAFEIVVGHRGMGGFSSLLLGSVGLITAQEARVPVVIVRGDGDRHDMPVAVGAGPKDDASVLGYAFEAAAVRNVPLRVVRAWQAPDRLLRGGDPTEFRQAEEKVRWDVIEAHAPWRERFPGVAVTEDVIRDHAVAALSDVSRECGLLVVGTHARGRPGGTRLGSVCHGVVHHAHCPVAVVHAPV